jgi:photosystem II stability/assembly factor-like uncharacterized protein
MLNQNFEPMKNIFIVFFMFLSNTFFAQNTFEQIRQQYLQEINNAAHNEDDADGENEIDKFKRWEFFASRSLDKNGNFPNCELLLDNWEAKKQLRINSALKSNNIGNWTSLNPSVIPIGGPKGTGRVHKVYIEPWNTNNIWVCSSTGGLWKSTDAGNNWQALTDNLPTLGTSDIAVDPNNPMIIYLATGENSFALNAVNKGIFKSIDGGLSWTYLALDPNSNNLFNGNIFRILLNPSNSNILIAACTNGLKYSNDGGISWSTKKINRFFDAEFHPNNPDTVYACNANEIYRSTDAGASWTLLNTGIPSVSRRIELAVSPDGPNYVYALVQNSSFGYGGLYRSTDAGNTWTLQSTSPSILGNVYNPNVNTGGYDYCELTIDPTNKDKIYTAGNIYVCKSSDGGITFSAASTWSGPYTTTGNGVPSNYVHLDMHDIIHHPTLSDVVFVGCDGGVFKTENGGNTWSILGNQMHIAQIYRIGTASNPDTIGYGTQDNSHYIKNGNAYVQIGASDGMEFAFDPNMSSNFYYVTQNGRYIARFSNGFYANISPPEQGYWIAPFFLDVENHDTLYVALKDVFVSYNRGTTWNNFSNGAVSSSFKTAMLQAPSDPNVIYLSSDSVMYKSTDRGQTWASLGLPAGSGVKIISYIAIDHNNPQHLWISYANFENGNKVFESTDGGLSWINISLNLPNSPVNCIIHENNSNNGLYVGTDVGVYYYNSNLGSWIDFNNQLPNVIVMELEIAPSIGKIRAGTYGRGLWESDIYSNSSSTDEPLTLKEELILFPNPANNIVNIKIPEDWKAERVLFEIYDINGKRIEAEYQNTTNFSKNIEYLANGIYVIAISSNSRHFVKRLVKQ